MTRFSKRIEELIEESGETVQSLAEMGNINRSTLQRVKTGERLPTKKVFNSLCKSLRLSNAETEELQTLLEITQVGERTYYNRQKIVELIGIIYELTTFHIPFSKEIKQKIGCEASTDARDKIQIVSGSGSVLTMIETSIDRELFCGDRPHLKLAIPSHFEAVYQHIFQQMLGNQKHLTLQDVQSFPDISDENAVDPGLGALKTLLGLSLLNNVTYHSHYCYHLAGDTQEINVLFPYFILTSEDVITISRDFSRAICYHDPELYSLYQKGFVNILQQTEPFIEESRDLFAIYSLDTTYRIRQVVEPLPCFAYYATHEMVADKVRKNLPFYEPLVAATNRFYDYFKQENRSMINVFSLKNLEVFMENGNMYFPDEVCAPFTPAERLMLTKRVRDDIQAEARKTYAFDEEKIALNSAVEFVNEATLVHLILHYKRAGQQVFKTIKLREENIVAAFDDFFRSLPGSPYVLPKEATVAAMDQLISQYEG
ncbi:helix-turn-helix domain-containing protein [Acetobacterium sp.]|uniref:helix-turn-helix domain-containing protein n=1 Tax=Acetobacterium sp. TaxID=1872094 RepID=UPI003593C5D9